MAGRSEPQAGRGCIDCGDDPVGRIRVMSRAAPPAATIGLLSAMAAGHMLADALAARAMSRGAALDHSADRIDAIWSIYAARRADLMAA